MLRYIAHGAHCTPALNYENQACVFRKSLNNMSYRIRLQAGSYF